MKPYGLQVIEGPDVDDIKRMGAKSSVGTICGRSGEHRGYNRPAAKARTRRYWARKARNAARSEIYGSRNGSNWE
jgi:hypothetical protein